ncbi:Endoglucanase A [Streptomyces sp. RB5]|uniref:Glucanase n=1 Tax=Streptomyces smaragdinus TaxID=2585196 RepID=A0A7K0CS99_9ACTN|nr:glycoside hydrolase family 6 protein [Streptomyces smaragdinus]MQY16375.1 Endoglucanase A [Streptomyces smaragdinus]
MRSRIRALVAAAALGVLLAVPSAPTAVAHGGDRLYTPPANPDAYTQIAGLLRDGRYADAHKISAMIRTPQAVWFGTQTPAEVRKGVAKTTKDAAREHAVPVLALYNVPGRDCANYSGGGASNTAEYQEWVDAIAAGIGTRPAMVILEPDSLALVPSDCGQDDAEQTLTAARFAEINYAVDALEPLRGTRVYLDTGHPNWHSVNSIAPRLIRGGVQRATGFFTNASNYQTEDASNWYGTLISSCIAFASAGGDTAACPNQWWPREDARAWISANVTASPADMAHFVTDTSRNGLGPWTPPAGKYTNAEDWCNPPGRGLGDRPTTRTGSALQDAKLWIKIPGESDGSCFRGTAGPEDPERGMIDPVAGHWFPEQALELATLASPPLH